MLEKYGLLEEGEYHDSSLEIKMLEILNRYSCYDSIYIGGNIPEKKLYNLKVKLSELANPLSIKGKVIALMDCTIFGSCKNGMALTTSGIYWINSWTEGTAENHITWHDLINREVISYADKTIGFCHGSYFEITTCGDIGDHVTQLITDLKSEYKRSHSYGKRARKVIGKIIADQANDQANDQAEELAMKMLKGVGTAILNLFS
jgi:hypothetical protein